MRRSFRTMGVEFTCNILSYLYTLYILLYLNLNNSNLINILTLYFDFYQSFFSDNSLTIFLIMEIVYSMATSDHQGVSEEWVSTLDLALVHLSTTLCNRYTYLRGPQGWCTGGCCPTDCGGPVWAKNARADFLSQSSPCQGQPPTHMEPLPTQTDWSFFNWEGVFH